MWFVHVHRPPLQCCHCQQVRGSDWLGRDRSSGSLPDQPPGCTLQQGCSAVECPGPTCLSHLFILLERRILCSLNLCDLFFAPHLCVSIQSSRPLVLPSRLCPIFSVFLLCYSATCHSHTFHTSHLIIFATFLCRSQAYLLPAPFPFPVPPQKPSPPPFHLLSAALCPHPPTASDNTAYLTGGFPGPHPIFRFSRKAWSHQKRSTPSARDQPAQVRYLRRVPSFGGGIVIHRQQLFVSWAEKSCGTSYSPCLSVAFSGETKVPSAEHDASPSLCFYSKPLQYLCSLQISNC